MCKAVLYALMIVGGMALSNALRQKAYGEAIWIVVSIILALTWLIVR